MHLRTRLTELDQPVLFPLDAGPDADGGAGPVLAIYGIPWLEPRLVADQLGVDTASHFEVTRAATARIRADLAARAGTRTVHSVVLAHTFASGGISSDSERDLSIGGVGAVPLDLFDGFGYTALGHLHGRQELSPTVRYSGSPLAYSFSEAKHKKGSWLLDVDAGGIRRVSEVLWEAPRTLAVLRGKLEELLVAEDHAWAESAYCQITLTDAQRPAQAMERLRARFPDTLVLGFDPEGAGAAAKPATAAGSPRPRTTSPSAAVSWSTSEAGRPTTVRLLSLPKPWNPCAWKGFPCEDPSSRDLRLRAFRRHRTHRF